MVSDIGKYLAKSVNQSISLGKHEELEVPSMDIRPVLGQEVGTEGCSGLTSKVRNSLVTSHLCVCVCV